MRRSSRYILLLALLPTSIEARLAPDDLNRLVEKSQQEANHSQYADAEADLTRALAQAKAGNNIGVEVAADEQFSSIKEHQNDLDGAELWLYNAVDSLKRSNPGSQFVALMDLQDFYARHHLLGKEVDNLKRIIDAWSSSAGSDSLGVASFTDSLAQVHFLTGDSASAERELRSVLAIYEKNGMSTSPACDLVRRHLITVLTKEGNQAAVAEMTPFLQSASPHQQHPDFFPQVISKPEPKYPEKALQTKLGGFVSVVIEVDETGHPQNLRIVRPLGLGFDENAIAAIRTWTFKPATKDGVPVSCDAMVSVEFRLYPKNYPKNQSVKNPQ